jgi:peptidoglycan/xylan/chitin deacetylase (PgdA/CDA1 family)
LSRLAILSYHKVGEPAPGGWETWYYVPRAQFREHLEQLVTEGWEPLDAAGVIGAVTGAATLPEKAVHVTFDDAYRMLVDEALPLLREYGFPGTVFVPTEYVGGVNDFDFGKSREPREPICSWDELRLLQEAGMSIQSHGVTHRAVSDLDEAALVEELAQSKDAIESQLGEPVEWFAFPYGDPGRDPVATSRALQSCGYRAACLYGGAGDPFDPASSDPFRLSRVAVGRDTGLGSLA